jgi:hypothetical protein
MLNSGVCTARILTEAASTEKMIILIFKDISWLWRSAYNCAVQGCSEWECAGEQISELFDIAKEVTCRYVLGAYPLTSFFSSCCRRPWCSCWKHVATHRRLTLTPNRIFISLTQPLRRYPVGVSLFNPFQE